MGVETEKYIRKPLYVDAVRVTEENFDELTRWCSGTIETKGEKRFIRVRVQHPKNPRQTTAFVGDWLLWTERSGFKVYTHAAFRRSFDVVTPLDETGDKEIKDVDNRYPDDPAPGDDSPNPRSIPHEDQPILDVSEKPQVSGSEETGRTEDDEPKQKIAGVDARLQDDRRVLTEEEQKVMEPEQVRELVRSGEVVLEQDLAA